MYLEKVCVPGSTSRKSFSAATIVRRYDSGVRAIVDKNKCPPGYTQTFQYAYMYEMAYERTAHLDELSARPQERRRVVDVLDDLHRTDNIEPPWLTHELLDCPMSKDDIGCEGRIRSSVA